MIKAGIIGATGYAGNEIVRLLLGHKDVEIKWFGSRSYIDQQYADIYQNFFKLVDAKCMDDNMAALADEVDVIFTATPQGLCASLINEEILSKCKVIDLSADFRIGIDVMTTETTCLSSIWKTDEKIQEFYDIHGRSESYKELNPGNVAYYDGVVYVDLSTIKPMIAMRNGSQSGATLYASSRSAQGTAGPDFRLEMEGVQFSEIPMLSGGNNALMQQALSATHNDYSLARLYAMGVDAWSLASHFSQMRQVPGYQIQGNTGELTANQDCVINRKLSWLKYQQGQIVPAN